MPRPGGESYLSVERASFTWLLVLSSLGSCIVTLRCRKSFRKSRASHRESKEHHPLPSEEPSTRFTQRHSIAQKRAKRGKSSGNRNRNRNGNREKTAKASECGEDSKVLKVHERVSVGLDNIPIRCGPLLRYSSCAGTNNKGEKERNRERKGRAFERLYARVQSQDTAQRWTYRIKFDAKLNCAAAANQVSITPIVSPRFQRLDSPAQRLPSLSLFAFAYVLLKNI